jgi:hypothetical protein
MSRAIPSAIHHTAFVVRDLEGTAQRLADALRIGPWNVWTIEPMECSVRGRKTALSFRVALATVGGGTFELITPHQGPSILAEALERHGDGFHHTCLVYPTIEAVRRAKAELLAQGRQALQEGSSGDAFEFGYFEFPEIGSLVELLYLDTGQLPPPERILEPSP